MDQKIDAIKEQIIPILEKNDVIRASIFGSFARGEESADSDIDILIEYGKPKGLFSFVQLQRELEEKIGRKVDLLTYNSIHPLLKEYIKRDEVKIYG
jgi:uncharacterized protein